MDKKDSYKPEWQPENAGDEFAVKIVKGTVPPNTGNSKPAQKINFNIDELYKGVLQNKRVALAKAITLIESNSPKHHKDAQQLLQKLLPHSENSIRIGITGIPGAGKSTLIEALGLFLINKGYKVAVLTIDPSSSLSKGSILGDKTRMEKLSRETNCFIRPSPTGGALGGVARKTRETITVCEAAGYDIILIETVGVGQSEITVRSMVDFFVLVLIAGAGDDLQGIKKGIMELTDCIVVNKADGDNKERAGLAKQNYELSLHYLRQVTKGWSPKVITASALFNDGIEDLWSLAEEFISSMKASGEFHKKRQEQALEWTNRLIEDGLKKYFYDNMKIKTKYDAIKNRVSRGEIPPTTAAELLLNELYKSEKK